MEVRSLHYFVVDLHPLRIPSFIKIVLEIHDPQIRQGKTDRSETLHTSVPESSSKHLLYPGLATAASSHQEISLILRRTREVCAAAAALVASVKEERWRIEQCKIPSKAAITSSYHARRHAARLHRALKDVAPCVSVRRSA